MLSLCVITSNLRQRWHELAVETWQSDSRRAGI